MIGDRGAIHQPRRGGNKEEINQTQGSALQYPGVKVRFKNLRDKL